MRRTTDRRRRPDFDGLEGRRLMAGNVSVFHDSANILRIEGDGYDNAVGLSKGYGDNVIIYSLDNLTTINGQSAQFFYQYGQDIRVKLNGGHDTLQVDDLVTDRDLQVWGGHGNDSIYLGKAVIKDDLKIYPGSGFDYVELRGTTIGGFGVNSNYNDFVFNDGDGGSGLRIQSASDGTPTTIERDAIIDVGYFTFDDPWVEIQDASVGDDLTVNGHSNNPSSSLLLEIDGTTVEDNLVVSSTYGPDEVTITDSAMRDLYIETGNHNDSVLLDGVSIEKLLSVDLGSNHDSLVIEDAEIGTADVQTGSGNDTVSLTRVDLRGTPSLFALGAGSDSMAINGGSVAQGLTVDGGEDKGGGDYDSLRLYDSAEVFDELIRFGLEYFRRFS